MALNPYQEQVVRVALALAEAEGFALAGGDAMLAHQLVQSDQRSVELPFTRNADGTLSVNLTDNAAVLPAGTYMLFTITGTGADQVPSVASQLFVTKPGSAAPAVAAAPAAATAVSTATATGTTSSTSTTGTARTTPVRKVAAKTTTRGAGASGAGQAAAIVQHTPTLAFTGLAVLLPPPPPCSWGGVPAACSCCAAALVAAPSSDAPSPHAARSDSRALIPALCPTPSPTGSARPRGPAPAVGGGRARLYP